MCARAHTHTHTHTHTHLHSVLAMGIDHTDILVELPVSIKNSRLLNCLLCELTAKDKQPDKMEYLGLSARYFLYSKDYITNLRYDMLHLYSQILEKNMQLMMASVDSLQQETYRLLGYEKNLAKQAQLKQQLLQKKVSQARTARCSK